MWCRPEKVRERGWLGWGWRDGPRQGSGFAGGGDVWSVASAAGWRWPGDGEARRDWLGSGAGEGRGREGRNRRSELAARHLRAGRCGWAFGDPGTGLSGGAVEAAGPAAQRGGSSVPTPPGRPSGSHRPGGSEPRAWPLLSPGPSSPPQLGLSFYWEAGDYELRDLHLLVWKRLPGEWSWHLSSWEPSARGFLLLCNACEPGLCEGGLLGACGNNPRAHSLSRGRTGRVSGWAPPAPGLAVAVLPSWGRTGRRVPSPGVARPATSLPTAASPEPHPACGQERPPGFRRRN